MRPLPRHPLPHHPLRRRPRHLRPDPFLLSHPDPIRGTRLSLSLSAHSSFLLSFSAPPSSAAVQWLSPPQTSGKSSPFVYTQCQAIHVRSVFPCQDTSAARRTYSPRLNVPRHLSAVMSARHLSAVISPCWSWR